MAFIRYHGNCEQVIQHLIANNNLTLTLFFMMNNAVNSNSSFSLFGWTWNGSFNYFCYRLYFVSQFGGSYWLRIENWVDCESVISRYIRNYNSYWKWGTGYEGVNLPLCDDLVVNTNIYQINRQIHFINRTQGLQPFTYNSKLTTQNNL